MNRPKIQQQQQQQQQHYPRYFLFLTYLLASTILTSLPPYTESSSSTINNPSSPSSPKSKIRYNEPDRFVSASPLCVAAACGDGIALLAIHSAVSHEPLLVPLENENHTTGNNNNTLETTTTTNNTTSNTTTATATATTISLVPDLPQTHRGPSRIHLIDGVGTCLITPGWMADGALLAKKCRSMASAHTARYGEEVTRDGLDYGRMLAEDAALWLANCVHSDNVRSLSCVGLLATCDSHTGFLWLIDATGAYRIRALAVGHGAGMVNKRMANIDFSDMSKREVMQQLMTIVAEEGKGSERDESWSLPPKSLIEIAFVDPKKREMTRVRQPFLLP